MKYYAPENASFPLPFQFDSKALFTDLEKCHKFNFVKNYVPANYNGENYILPLRSVGGRLDFPAASPNNADQFQDTVVLNECGYFKEVVDTFLCKKEAIRLMNLPPGKIVNTHTDHNCGYEDGIFRLHIPIITNDSVEFILNGKVLKMKPGEVWYTNVNLPHSVTNKGETNRIHLVLDCIRNDWSDALFQSVGYDFAQERNVKEELPMSTVLRMIEEFEIRGTKEDKIFLERLKKEHGIN